MKKTLAFLLFIMTSVCLVQAQSGTQASPDQITRQHNDSIILKDMILPLVSNGAATPNWETLATDVKAKYGESYVDRSVTKAKIYYYYGKEWPSFSKALVHFTEAFENKDDLKLMNKNAKMVLEYSQDSGEWKTALAWVKHAVDKEPGNAAYKETYDALTTKIKGNVLTGGQ